MDFIAAFNDLIGNTNPRDQRLFKAALGADIGRLERLIKAGGDVNAGYALDSVDYVPSADFVRDLPLIHFATIACQPDVIRFLTSNGSDLYSQYTVSVDETSKLYTGPILHNTVYYIGDKNIGLEKIQFLLDNYKLDVNSTNEYKKTLLDATIVKPCINMDLLAYLFIEKQAEFNTELLPDLLSTIREEKLELTILNECLKRGFDLTTDKNGNVLHYLATVVDHSVGLSEILETIHARYTEKEIYKLVTAGDDDGRTPLSLYSGHPYYRIHTGLFDFLIKHGADVNTQDNNGNTPLMYAGFAQRKDNCEHLVANGADVVMQNYEYKDALDFAEDANPALTYLWTQYLDHIDILVEDEPEPDEPEVAEENTAASAVRYVMK